MSDPELEPLSPELSDLLRPGVAEPLSSPARARLLERIDASLATAASFEPPATPSTPVTSATTGLAAGKVSALVIASLVGGAAVSRVVEHRFFPPEPVVVERVVVKTQWLPAPVAPPVTPTPTPVVSDTPPVRKPVVEKRPIVPPVPERPAVVSSRERQLLEGARTALIKRDASAALQALSTHRQEFPTGQLAEERDALEVQALVAAGKREDARAAAVRFKTAYPDSVFGPSVEIFVQ